MDSHLIRVNLFIKADSRQLAESKAAKRLNDWFVEDPLPPFQDGSLLFWYVCQTQRESREAMA